MAVSSGVAIRFWIFVSIVLGAFAPQTRALANPNVDVANVEVQVSEIRDEMERLFLSHGTGSVLKYWRGVAERQISLRALRQIVLESNNQKPEIIKVKVPRSGGHQVSFANRMLKESGIDFYEYRAEIDSTLPDVNEPRENEKESYDRWQKTRSRWAPLMGFAASAAEGAMMIWSGHVSDASAANRTPAILASLAKASAVFGIERMFSETSSWWARKVWSNERPLVLLPQFKAAQDAELSHAKARINEMLGHLNELTKPLHFVKVSHFYSYLVNMGCVAVITGAGMTASFLGGGPFFENGEEQFVSALGDMFLRSNAFYFAFALGQIAASEIAKRGEISELFRFQIETFSVKVNLLLRSLSLVPTLKEIALGLQLGFGTMLTVPLLLKTGSAKSYARETHRLFESSDSGVVAPPSGVRGYCERALSKVYGALALNRSQTAASVARASVAAVTNRIRAWTAH